MVAIDLDARKRRRALELGADEARPPRGRGRPLSARAVLDFVGSDQSLALAAGALQEGGLLVLVGAAGGTLPFGLGGDVPWEVHLTTSILGSLDDLAAVLEHARRGELDWHVEPVPLARANQALARLRRGDVLGRLVLVP